MVTSDQKWELTMSRRSILLATTFYVAIGSLAAVGPVSAHGFGFGGFGGGQAGPALASRSLAYSNISRAPIQSMSNSMSNLGGTRFGHTPSIGGPAVGSNIVGSRIEPARIPAAANAPLTNTSTPAMTQSVRPAQLPPTITSSGIGARQPVDTAGTATAPIQSRVSAAGIVSAPVTARYPVNQPSGTEVGLSSRINSAEGDGKLPKPGSTEGVPNVTGAPRIIGQGSSPEHGPGSSGVTGEGPTINLPGTQGLGQKGPREVPGFGDATSGPQVNLPGTIDRHGPDAANKAISKMEGNDKQLLDAANQGGPNSENIPTSPGAGIAVSDDTSGKKSGSGGSGKTSGSGSSIAVAPGVSGSNGTGPTKDGGTMTVSTVHDGNTTYQVVTTKDKDGNITGMTYSEKKDGSSKVITKSTGPEIPAKKDKTPNEDDTTGTIGSLNPNSGVGKTGNGGGTDNNGTETSVQSSQLANGTSLGRTGNGDGTGNHGDNNGVDKNGNLAAGTSLARKDYGDGGGSDNRDGGDPHQKAAAAAAAAANRD
jgi:hypothetical protein